MLSHEGRNDRPPPRLAVFGPIPSESGLTPPLPLLWAACGLPQGHDQTLPEPGVAPLLLPQRAQPSLRLWRPTIASDGVGTTLNLIARLYATPCARWALAYPEMRRPNPRARLDRDLVALFSRAHQSRGVFAINRVRPATSLPLSHVETVLGVGPPLPHLLGRSDAPLVGLPPVTPSHYAPRPARLSRATSTLAP